MDIKQAGVSRWSSRWVLKEDRALMSMCRSKKEKLGNLSPYRMDTIWDRILGWLIKLELTGTMGESRSIGSVHSRGGQGRVTVLLKAGPGKKIAGTA